MNAVDNMQEHGLQIEFEALEYRADGSARAFRDSIQTESLLEVRVNGLPLMRVACIADHLAELVVGRLFTDGSISGMDDIASIEISDEPLRVDVQLAEGVPAPQSGRILDVPTHGGASTIAGIGTAPAPAEPGAAHTAALPRLEPVVPIPWNVERIFELARVFDADSPAHARTFAAHSCYLATADELLFCCEDLGRHNAFDKAIGSGLMAGVDLSRCIVFTSGRVPIDMVAKAIRARIPILVSKAVPTDKTIQIARNHNLTLICSAHPDAIRVFNDPAAR